MLNFVVRIYTYFQTDQQAQLILSAYHTLCDQGDACTTAGFALLTDANCTATLENEDAAVFCSGSCRSLTDALLNSCPNNVCLF